METKMKQVLKYLTLILILGIAAITLLIKINSNDAKQSYRTFQLERFVQSICERVQYLELTDCYSDTDSITVVWSIMPNQVITLDSIIMPFGTTADTAENLKGE